MASQMPHDPPERRNMSSTLEYRNQLVSDYDALLAAKSGKYEVIERWIEQRTTRDDFNINILSTKHDYTALMYAANEGHEYIVRLLIKNGADLGYSNRWGYDALDRAIVGSHDGTALALLDGYTTQGASPGAGHLYWAVRFGRTAIVERLLQWPLDLDAKEPKNVSETQTLEEIAQERDFQQILDLLRNARACQALAAMTGMAEPPEDPSSNADSQEPEMDTPCKP